MENSWNKSNQDWKIDPILTFSGTSVFTNSTNAEIFAITDAKLYVLVVTLLTNNNAKALQELKSRI